MMWGYNFNGAGMVLMMFGSIVGIVLLVVVIWAVVRWLNGRTVSPKSQPAASGPAASEILQQRYARGEIDAATFEQMRERLGEWDRIPYQGWAEVRRPAGESLFDGKTSGTEVR